MVLLALAGPVAAQDLVFSAAITESCLASGEAEACVGEAAVACMEQSDGGQTTVGMGGCLDKELTYWDGQLNAAYRAVMARAKAVDAEMQDLGATVSSQAKALLAMQRAWIVFRDEKCSYERSQWGGGTGGGPATLDCLMQETARQTFYLRDASEMN